MSTAARAALGAALLIAAIALFVVLRDGGDDDSRGGTYGGSQGTREDTGPGSAEEATPKPRRPAVPTIVVREGDPVGGAETIDVDVGDRARFRIRSDVAEEVHVHGYDVTEAIPAGGVATVSFGADIEGIFEIELHGSGAQIAELRVNP